MEEHSYYSNLSNDDSIEFYENRQIKIEILRKALIDVYSVEMETALQRILLSQGIKTPYSTKNGQFYEYTKTHINNWLGNGVACRVSKLGEQQWQQGKIKIKLEIEFEPDKIPSENINIGQGTSIEQYLKYLQSEIDKLKN